MEIVFPALELFLRSHSYIFTFVSFIIGVIGLVVGIYNWRRRVDIVNLREKVISSHFQSMRALKDDSGKFASTLNFEFDHIYKNFLSMLDVVMNPSTFELERWLRDGLIDKFDHDYLSKLKLRK